MTHVLLLAGLGPDMGLDAFFTRSLFDTSTSAQRHHRDYFRWMTHPLSLDRLMVRDGDARVPLLRERHAEDVPHLATATVEAILREAGTEFETLDLAHVWNEDAEPATTPDVVFVSTSFICNEASLDHVLAWITERWQVPIILGGQYSNIKYPLILRRYPDVTAVLRGDGEHTIPAILEGLRINDLRDVPNIAVHVDGQLHAPAMTYVDMEELPAPRFTGPERVVPYESMRGCPYGCKFCSFPAASPKFRWRSAQTIRDDWQHYRDHNGAEQIRALDSIFTIPHTRMRELMDLMAGSDLPTWEGFSRASTIKNSDYVDMLENGRCHQLSIGFESMSDDVLGYMNKRVTAAQNRRANELLRGSSVGCRGHFMVGYPGETPDDFAQTSDYLAGEYAGEFKLSIFSFTDETMPVWNDAERFDIRIDAANPEYGWQHVGMNVRQARRLHQETIRRVRWESDEAVWLFWQSKFHTPLVPGLDRWSDLHVQKLVERIAMLPVDIPDPREGRRLLRGLMSQLAFYGIRYQRDKVSA